MRKKNPTPTQHIGSHARTLQEEETKKVVFLAPKKALALQQARLLLRHIGQLRTDEICRRDGSDARWRLGVSCGNALYDSSDDLLVHWRHVFYECQLAVMTPASFEHALTHCCVRMSDIALLVIDEAHNLRGQSLYHSM